MPLAPQLTVGDAVRDVLERCGFADQGTAVLTASSRVRAFLRQASRELFGRAEWSDLRHEMELPLIEGQDRYEFPDETVLGGLQNVELKLANGSRETMDAGVRTHDVMPTPNEDTGFRVATGQPDRWRVIDRELQILPAPTDQFPALIITYKSGLTPMLDDKELMPFEPELLIQRAVVITKTHYQKPGIQEAARDFALFLKDRIAAQRGRRSFMVGGRKSHYVTRDKRVPRSGGFGHTGEGAAFSDSWNPW